MPTSLEQLRAICPHAPAAKLQPFVAPLNEAMAEFEINTPARELAFIAQIAHESGGFVYTKELASGNAYEGNRHLGNTEPGDGPRFKGRGLVQITGRKNYALCGNALGLPLRDSPQLLEAPAPACRSAAWFWAVGAGLNLSRAAHEHGIQDGCNLNDLADAGDFEGITLAINGGLNGYQDRLAYLQRGQEAVA